LVIPFGVLRGDASLDWLRQGSVDMLTRNLAQWRDVGVIDYEHTLDLMREAKLDGASTVTLSQARQLAREVDAGRVVLGQIQRNEDSVTVVARVYGVDDDRMLREIAVSGAAAADPRLLFDRLANELLGLAGAPNRRVEVARITTASVEAYREYLRGVRALHAWSLEAADSAFGRATGIDSTFALAYYKRAQTESWRRPFDTLARYYARLAAAYADRLPTRERTLVTGSLDYLEGNYVRAQQRFGTLLEQDSTDAEAWYGLGDAYYHAPPKSPEDIATRFTQALRAFNRAIAHDSSFHLAYSHQVEIYRRLSAPGFAWIVEGETIHYVGSEEESRRFGRERIERARARAGELAISSALRWVDADPTAGPPYEALADAYAAVERYDEAVATLEQAMRRPASRHADFPYRIASYQLASRPNDALATLREAMRTYGRDSLARRGGGSRFAVLRAAANVPMATGALADMERLLDLASAVDRLVPGTLVSGRDVPTTLLTDPLAVIARAFAGVTVPRDRRTIETTVAQLEAIPDPTGSRLRKENWAFAYGAYVITGGRKYIDAVRQWSGEEPPLVLQALAALREGDTARAAQLAARFPPPDRPRLSAPTHFDDPLNAALVLGAVGQPRAAIALLESIRPTQLEILRLDPRWAMYPRTLLERGRLYEKIGNATQAVASYERYLDVMRDADAVFHPQIELARARLQALRAGSEPRAAR
jgi:tetratricopeptide (TPR) repeat protein